MLAHCARGHTPLAIACQASCCVAKCCIREIGQISFTPAPPSMAQHAGYARMTPEIARAAIRLHGWPQRPPARELSLCPVLVGRCSAPVRCLLWTMSKRAPKKSKIWVDARAARAIVMIRAPCSRCACFYLDSLLWTLIIIFIHSFACFPCHTIHTLVVVERIMQKY